MEYNAIEIEPKNNKGEWHGYQEWYYPNGKLRCRGIMKHDLDVGYQEYHQYEETEFYIR
jgi:hypothetical protein